ncbi:SWI/SNF complex subunit SWI3B [Pyrus ussuriensis x Pyrus communis]|uniref:SWI/SNF complex subunit SWI3B n=1 Tax=Pyrus ussuriensis x Pyrus communis TaxID=2448454 RepID=A0A5N5HEI6_9ROSA|nr:SWI/SNF complex subunit SWI3B [Pyrus ussuriensis x Pyrus communis]
MATIGIRMVKIREEMGRGWDDEDTMHLLEALTHYGDDWRKVAQYVGKSEKEFVTHFIKIPFGEEFIADLESKDAPSPCKRMCLTPLADAGNPIMAQFSFVAQICFGHCCVFSECRTTLICETSRLSLGSRPWNARPHDANSQLEKEGMDVEREISGITQIHEKIVRFEALELHMEKEWQKLEQMKSMLFLDKLTLLFVKS